MSAQVEKVVLVGQGYVGLPVAMAAVEAGYDVVGIDLDVTRVKKLNVGESFVEDITDERLAAALASGRYKASYDYADAAGFDICVITVPTPLREGIPDLTFIEEAGRAIAEHVRPGCTVILESTTYPGTTDELLRPIIEGRTGLVSPGDFHLGYSPERIDPGNPNWHLENTPKVVSGLDGAALEKVQGFYGRLVERTVPVANVRTAELTKLLENTFRHVNIALVNELAIFAGQLGVDVWEAIDAAASKPFGFMPFRPGPGVGGHCLPIDPSYLSWQVKRTLGHSFRFIELANDINDRMPEHVVQRLIGGLNNRRKAVNGSRILLLGLAYKKNVGDCRESPAIHVAEALRKLGAEVRAVEPYAEEAHLPSGVAIVDLTAEELATADAVVILTDHDVFDYAAVGASGTYVFDTRNRCNGDHVERI
ncbi:nucleotide sugar dehydrogenase [Planosporangium sp. 12N6]|uniref:nucleotide sugar dehydrogenase n=1 Tax=Planosporangium spinosum TaxID=3402278 RepID=UPI003CF07842